MGKRKICKIVFVILSIFLCVAFYELFGICIAYKKQPEVSNTIKKETQNDSWNERSENMERAVIIEKNPEALLQRVRLIRNAKEDIILSTFAFQSDESGKLILGALHDAADRGVHVRLLVDGMESWVDMEGNPYFYGLSSHENVEIKLYNKANPLKHCSQKIYSRFVEHSKMTLPSTKKRQQTTCKGLPYHKLVSLTLALILFTTTTRTKLTRELNTPTAALKLKFDSTMPLR